MSIPIHHVNPPVRLLVAFQEAYPDTSPDWLLATPGREMWVAAAQGQPYEFSLVVPDLDGRAVFTRQSAKNKRTVTNRPLPQWARYPAGVLVVEDEIDSTTIGLNAVIVGEEPPGPRYNHALGMAFATLWYELHARPYTAESLIEIVDRVRREYVEG